MAAMIARYKVSGLPLKQNLYGLGNNFPDPDLCVKQKLNFKCFAKGKINDQ
jgi:hypothetical protein